MHPSRPRVAIVGGGIAGVSAAWLLDGSCDVELFEREERLGGHAETIDVEVRGTMHAIDVGAQFIGERTHPTFTALLDVAGGGRASSAPAVTVTREMGTTLGDQGAAVPRFVSPMLAEGRMWPLFARWNLAGQAAFGILALRARALAASDDDDLLVDDWLRSLPGLTADQRERVLLPWIAALAGCSIDDARRFSARAAVSVPARAMPQSPVEPFTWTTLHGGLGRFVTEFAVACTTLTPRLAAPAIAIERSEHAWTVVTERRRHHDFDHLVFAAPPYALRELIASAPGLEQARTILDGFEYFPTRVAIHTDPLNVHPDRRMWSAYNAITNATHCEGSIWYGALRDLLPDGGTLDVFKSWISARDTEPRELVHQRSFRHPLISPAFHAAQRRLSQHQGRGNVWFTGSYCHDVDLQETALVSAMSVASRLAPQAKNLQALRARVTQRWIDRSAPKQGRGRASGVFSAITGAARRLSRAGAEIRARTKTGQ